MKEKYFIVIDLSKYNVSSMANLAVGYGLYEVIKSFMLNFFNQQGVTDAFLRLP